MDFTRMLITPITQAYELSLPLKRGKHVVVEGIEVHVRIFARWKPTLKRSLPDGESAHMHVLRPDGPAYPKQSHGFLRSKTTTYDLTPFKDATVLVVRHITGYGPMDVVS